VVTYCAKGLVALIILGCLASTAWAQQPRDVKIVTIGFAPYGIKSDKGLSGIYYDTANLLMNDVGYASSNTITPYARIISELISGQSDMTIMFKYDDLENYVTYVAALPTLKIVVMGIKGSTFSTVDSLKGKRLAYLRGASFSKEVDNNADVIIQRTTDFSQGIKMLMANHADAIIGPMDPILAAAANMGIAQNAFGKPLIVGERTPWVQVSNKSLNIVSVKKLAASFKKLLDEGVLNKLRGEYLKVKEIE